MSLPEQRELPALWWCALAVTALRRSRMQTEPASPWVAGQAAIVAAAVKSPPRFSGSSRSLFRPCQRG